MDSIISLGFFCGLVDELRGSSCFSELVILEIKKPTQMSGFKSGGKGSKVELFWGGFNRNT
jgi:hypothetical protein